VTGIRPLAFDQLDPDLREALRPRYERLGYLGGFFQVMGHQPEALAAFDRCTESCKRALGPALAETIALTVATLLDNRYERNQHERLAVRSGLNREWVAAVEELQPDDARLAAGERVVQRFALAAARRDVDTADALDAVVAELGDEVAAAVALLTARFVAHALISAACRLEPVVPSIFEDGFDG
jgi:alkylhydroperoxidase family enzyme